MAAVIDLNSLHNPSTGTIPPASWGDAIRDNFQTLATRPAASVSSAIAQAVTTGGTGEQLACATEAYDTDGMHSNVTNNTRLTIVTAGLWLFTATALFANDTTGNRGLSFRIDDTTNTERMLVPASGGANSTVLTATMFAVFTAGQWVEVRATHSKGSDLNVTCTEFSAVLLNF